VLLWTRHVLISGDLNACKKRDAFQMRGDLNARNPIHFKWGSRVNGHSLRDLRSCESYYGCFEHLAPSGDSEFLYVQHSS